MQHRHLPHLVVLSCLTATGASAGTVTLLSQERSVSASIDDTDAFAFDSSDKPPPFVFADTVESAEAGLFDEIAEVTVTDDDLPEGFRFISGSPSTASARQVSDFEQVAGDVQFSLSASTFTSFDNANTGAESRFDYRVSFQVEEATNYALAGTGRASATFVFRFENEKGETVRELSDFTTVSQEQDERYVFDGTGRDPMTGELLDNTGTLAAGTYELEIIGFGFTSNFIDFGDVQFDDFGLILRDSTLAIAGDPPAVIPSPAALPAGLALLTGGLLRRRRAA